MQLRNLPRSSLRLAFVLFPNFWLHLGLFPHHHGRLHHGVALRYVAGLSYSWAARQGWLALMQMAPGFCCSTEEIRPARYLLKGRQPGAPGEQLRAPKEP